MIRAFTAAAAAAVLCEQVKAEAVCFQPDGVCDAAVHRITLTATALKHLLPAQDVAADNLTEGLTEFTDAVGVDKGVDHGVGVGEDNSHIHDPEWRTSTLRTEEGEAVDDV